MCWWLFTNTTQVKTTRFPRGAAKPPTYTSPSTNSHGQPAAKIVFICLRSYQPRRCGYRANSIGLLPVLNHWPSKAGQFSTNVLPSCSRTSQIRRCKTSPGTHFRRPAFYHVSSPSYYLEVLNTSRMETRQAAVHPTFAHSGAKCLRKAKCSMKILCELTWATDHQT